MHALLFPVILGVTTATYYFLKTRRRRPPGPPAFPVLGNLFQMPRDYEWKTYAQWAEKYGWLVHSTLLVSCKFSHRGVCIYSSPWATYRHPGLPHSGPRPFKQEVDHLFEQAASGELHTYVSVYTPLTRNRSWQANCRPSPAPAHYWLIIYTSVGFNQSIPLMPYSPRFLTLRRLIHKEMTESRLKMYWPLYEEESRVLIEKVLLDPEHFSDHIR
jgi:hypothetical protein